MQIERTLNRGDWQFIEVGADGRQRCRVVGVLARSNAAEIDLGETGAALLDRDRWQELNNVGKFFDLQLVKLFGADCSNRDWHILQILFALLRRDDNDIAFFFSNGVLRHCGHRQAQRCRSKKCGYSNSVSEMTHKANLPCLRFCR